MMTNRFILELEVVSQTDTRLYVATAERACDAVDQAKARVAHVSRVLHIRQTEGRFPQDVFMDTYVGLAIKSNKVL